MTTPPAATAVHLGDHQGVRCGRQRRSVRRPGARDSGHGGSRV